MIAHEIGHNREQHAKERIDSQVATAGALQLVSAALQVGDVAYANAIAGALGAGAQYGMLLPYSRNQELEADAFGVILMAEAGYDPRAALDLWESMSEQGGARPPELLSTHPAPDQRIQRLATLMPQALARYRARRGLVASVDARGRHQLAPVPLSTARRVRSSSARSVKSDQFSM